MITTKVRDINRPSISSEEEISHTMEVEEAVKNNERISLGEPSNRLKREKVEDKLEVFEIVKLLLYERLKKRYINNPSLSSEEEINHTTEVEENGKKDENISRGDTRSKPQEEKVEEKLEVFEILKLLLNVE